jgi:phosphate starvation-inducible PhoH-like protein
VEQDLGISVHARGNQVRLSGAEDRVRLGRQVLEQLYGLLRDGRSVAPGDVHSAIQAVATEPGTPLHEVYSDVLAHVGARRRIAAKNLSQRHYIDLIEQHDVVISIGPAGTGKTYLAMAMAVAALNRQEIARVILARPAVEAGEKLGFLPGNLAEKVNPYLRPLYDALHDMMDFDKAQRLMERGVIEVAPLAFMRGRTLNESFVILDEAQNTTPEQMKMFLTRLGYDSKAVITGDVTQIDLPSQQPSGLIDAIHVLRDVDGIGFMRFTDLDVVRHPLVQAIVRAYDRREAGLLEASRENGAPDAARGGDGEPSAE